MVEGLCVRKRFGLPRLPFCAGRRAGNEEGVHRGRSHPERRRLQGDGFAGRTGHNPGSGPEVTRSLSVFVLLDRKFWGVEEQEYSTDVIFRDSESLAALYPALLRH